MEAGIIKGEGGEWVRIIKLYTIFMNETKKGGKTSIKGGYRDGQHA